MSISRAALDAMIKLRKETSNNVAGRRQLSSDERLNMELELAKLQSMVLPQNEKHKLPLNLYSYLFRSSLPKFSKSHFLCEFDRGQTIFFEAIPIMPCDVYSCIFFGVRFKS